MERAEHDRSAQAAPASAGTLDVAAQAPGQPAAGPGRAGSSRMRRIAAHPVVRQAVLLLVFIAAGVAVTWPLATDLPNGRLPSSRDTASYVWGFWWVAHQVTHLGNPWFTSQMAAPVGVQLGFHTLIPLPGLLLTPVTLIFGPSASYNLLVLITPGLLCYAMYRAARLWLPSATGAIAAGAFFGLSAMLTQQDWYHVNIALGSVFLPAALEASVRLRRTPGLRQAVILGLVMGAAVLTDQESAVLAAIVTGLTLLPWLVRHPSWAKLRPAALAVVIGTVLASPQLLVMAQEAVFAHARGGLAIDPHLLAVSYKQYGIGLPGMFTPTPRVADFGLDGLAGPFLHGRDNEGLPMFGTVLTVLALFGLAVSWRRRSAWLLAALWAGCAVLALGTSLWIGKHQYLPLAQTWHDVRVSGLMPYTWFVRIPGLASFRNADRLAILGLVPAALLAGAAVNWFRYHAKSVVVVVVALGILPFGLDRGGYPVRPAGRDPRLRLALLRQGAGDGHRRRSPAGDRLHLTIPEVRHQRDRGAPLLPLPEPHAASTADGLPLGAAGTRHVAPGPPGGGHRLSTDGRGGAAAPAQAFPGPGGGGPAGRQPHECRVGRGMEAEHQHQRLRPRLPQGHRIQLLLPGRQRARVPARLLLTTAPTWHRSAI